MLARALTWPLVPALLVAGAVIVAREPSAAGPVIAASDVPYVTAMVACWLIGVVLTGLVFEQVAGWAFLGLATAMAWSAFLDEYAELALVWERHDPAGAVAAALGNSSFVWWFVFLALALQFTPPRRSQSRWERLLPAATLVVGTVYQVGALLRSSHLDPPHEDMVSPWAIDALSGPIAAIAAAAVALLGLCLLASVAVLVAAWRRSEGESRRQLLWLVAGALPLVPFVIASYAVSYAGYDYVAGYFISVAIVTVALGAALSITRYRLYKVERVVTDSAAYAIAAGAVVAAYVVVVVVISRSTPVAASAQLPTILATLAGVAVARVSYVWAGRAVGRRIDRRRFEAVERLRAEMAPPNPDLDAAFRKALGDPNIRILYGTPDGTWVTADGHAVVPSDHAVEVRRRGAVGARVEFNPANCDRRVVEAVAREATAEIDNVALQAELARQIEVVTESRTRLATAQLEERTRIERDLHDGAQQRLLAIALQLQSARVNGGRAVLEGEVDRAVLHLGQTVQELRGLAAGLQPTALAGGGLLAATVDLASRIPLRITYDVVDKRFAASLESAAWFVIAEAVANAVKHAGVDEVMINVSATDSALRVVVVDAGSGGADPRGSGLQGLGDRVAALRGSLAVHEVMPHGTSVEAEFPCVS